MIITIDGPAGSGKSTVSRILAKRLGFSFLDTGATYRAVTFLILEQNIDLNDNSAIHELLNLLDIKFFDEHIVVNGRDLSVQIRSPEIDSNVSRISQHPYIRQQLVEIQRSIGQSRDTVCEGRDIGSVVFPNADVKFYLDASLSERARRRWAQQRETELFRQFQEKSLAEIEHNIRERDQNDSERALSPLTIPPDALVIDSSNLSIEQVVDKMMKAIESKLHKNL